MTADDPTVRWSARPSHWLSSVLVLVGIAAIVPLFLYFLRSGAFGSHPWIGWVGVVLPAVSVVETIFSVLRTATRAQLAPDGALVLSAPLKTLRTRTAAVTAVSRVQARDAQWRDLVVDSADGRMTVARSLVTRAFVDVLRESNPDVVLPPRS